MTPPGALRNFIFKITNVVSRNNKSTTNLGRWNTLDNHQIKCTLANMDSCGDSLCGTPTEYKKHINNIIRNKKT